MSKKQMSAIELPPELSLQEGITVTPNDCATRWGNDNLLAFSTPAMLGYMEQTCVKALQPYLPSEMMSVGSSVTLHHLASTPVNHTVTIAVKLTLVEGKRLVFTFDAYDRQEKIGEGIHERFIVDRARFLSRLQQKQEG